MVGTSAWRRASIGAPVALGLVAFMVAAVIVRPVRAVLIGSDTASSVLYFQRIVSGETLERFLGTTPKPLLTLIDGLLYAGTGDWRPIAWLALIVYALAVASAVALATRVSSTVAGVFVGAGLIACPGLLQDVALAYPVSWTLLAVCVAGLCLTASRPRYGPAAFALACGALARQEIFILIGVAVAAVVVDWWFGRSAGDRGHERWLLLLALVAVPLSMIHDILLAGDPLYSLRVPTLGAEGRTVGGVFSAIIALAVHGLGNPVLLVLAGLGVASLIRKSAWAVLLGTSTLAIGVTVVVLFVGARGLVVLDRYALPVELALIFLAGSGVATIRVPELSALVARPIVLGLAAVVAVGVSPRIGPLDRETTERIGTEAQAGRDYRHMLPALAGEVAREPGLRASPASRDPRGRDLSGPVLYVTPRLLSIVLVDLDLRLDHVARSSQFDPATAVAPAGAIVLHIKRVDTQGTAAWAEVDAAATFPSLSVVPVARLEDRAWLLRVHPN